MAPSSTITAGIEYQPTMNVYKRNGYENIYKKTTGIEKKSCGMAVGSALVDIYDMFYRMANIPQHLFKSYKIPDGNGEAGVDRI